MTTGLCCLRSFNLLEANVGHLWMVDEHEKGQLQLGTKPSVFVTCHNHPFYSGLCFWSLYCVLLCVISQIVS